MNLNQANQNISDLCDMIEEHQALTRISPGYFNDLTDVETREPDTPDCPAELAEHNRAMQEWEQEDQEARMREAFPEGY